jgi:AP-1 complex subunit gamma-1
VGSVQPSKEDNLLGDDIPTSAPASNANGAAAALQNNQDLLAEIFGSSGSASPAPTTAATSPPSQKSTVDDILGLFGSNAPAASSPVQTSPTTQPTTSSVFNLPQTQTPPPQPAQPPKLTAYPAYDKNELRISLTPQTNPQRLGVVNILARFQVTGSSPVTGLAFQAAVPKVRQIFLKN